jgi:hypothetical protein
MKANKKAISSLLSIVAGSLLTVSVGHTATIPGSIFAFTPTVKNDVFVVKSKGWSDPAFGDMGWTHSSDWGTFSATAGQVVTIILKSTNLAVHPGATVWYRGANDTAPDNYVVDHFYPQNANFAKFGAVDENTGAALGNIIMKHIVHGYDQDNNSVIDTTLKGIKDKIPGRLLLKFKAPYTGTYIFVGAGFNPDAGVDTTLTYKIKVNVNVL